MMTVISGLIICFITFILGLQPEMASTMPRQRRFTNGDICNETNETLRMVTLCPSSNTFLQRSSYEKMCNHLPQCRGEQLVYHCTRYKEGFAEVCAPQYNITGYCCTVFDDGVGRVVEDFSRPCSECLFKYPSNDSVKYKQCISPLQKTLEETPNVTKEDSSKTPCVKEMKHSKQQTNCKTVSENKTISGIKRETDSTTYAFIVVPVIILIVCVIAVKVFQSYPDCRSGLSLANNNKRDYHQEKKESERKQLKKDSKTNCQERQKEETNEEFDNEKTPHFGNSILTTA